MTYWVGGQQMGLNNTTRLAGRAGNPFGRLGCEVKEAVVQFEIEGRHDQSSG